MATILVVDDSAANRELLVSSLEYQGYRLMEASDGAEALQIVRRERPHLVITDVLMPAMDGYEFVRQLRADPAIAQTQVIFCSSYYLEPEARTLGAKCGVHYVIQKPTDPLQVRTIVKASLGHTAGPVAPPEEFDREHLHLVTDKLSEQAAELRFANLRLTALVELGQRLSLESEPASLVRSYCREARRIIGAGRACVGILDDQGKLAQFCSKGMDAGTAAQVECLFSCTETLAEVVRERKPLRRCKITGDPAFLAFQGTQPLIHSLLATPIFSRERVYGLLCLCEKVGGDEFSELDEQLAMMLAAQLAVGYEQARLCEELRRRAFELERRESKYRMLMEQASDGIAIFDQQGSCIDVNHTFCEMLGYSREQVLELDPATLVPGLQQLTQLTDRHRDHQFVRRDGRTVLAEIGGSALDDGRVQLIFRDVTQRKSLEEQLRQAQKMEAVGRLAGGVAHDFNNLLTAIIGYGQLALADLEPDSLLRENIEEILVAADRAAALTRQLLAFSRKQVRQPERLDLNCLITDLGKMVSRIIGEDIKLILGLDPDLKPVMADAGQIEQVVLNLAVNARDAMSEGGTLEVRTENLERKSGAFVRLSVRDNGTGMSPEVQSHLFEPFFTTKARGKGTGLGLSTVYGIVTQSGGQIAVESQPGQGTTFHIHLPADGGKPAEKRSEVKPESSVPRGVETILLVEDDGAVRRLAASVLRGQGYKVLEASDGVEALHLAEHCGPLDLLVTDIVMPNMNGKELSQRLHLTRPGLKVVYSSGYAENAIVHQGVLDPGIAFLQKPFDQHSLIQKVREILDVESG